MKNPVPPALTALLFLGSLSTGCATIFSGWSYDVEISSTPDHAEIVVSNEDGELVYEGETPAVVTLYCRRGYFDGHTYRIDFYKPGYRSKTVIVQNEFDYFYFGNLIMIGGILGYALVDPLTGAMWRYPSTVHAELAVR